MPFYGVWVGKETGVFDSWEKCKENTQGYKGAKFQKLKATTLDSAQKEFQDGYQGKSSNFHPKGTKPKPQKTPKVPYEIVLTTDGAHDKNQGEYRGVMYPTNEEVFRSPVHMKGTHNIMEFLALVDGIKYLKEKGMDVVLYTDSVTAMAWYRDNEVRTTAFETGKVTPLLNAMINEGLEYLKSLDKSKVTILKWKTKSWGEIPADFGRK